MHRTARTLSAALAISLASDLTACGSGGGEGVAADAEQTLTVWAMGAEGEKLGAVADEYTKANPKVTVKVTPMGWDVAHQKLVSAAAAGTLPDVMQMGGTYMGEFAELGVLEPVDTKAFAKKDFFPPAGSRAWWTARSTAFPGTRLDGHGPRVGDPGQVVGAAGRGQGPVGLSRIWLRDSHEYHHHSGRGDGRPARPAGARSRRRAASA